MSNLVSIVIPSYKQAHFLPEAIESCLAQTYPHIEIIVVDDGSPDDVKAVTDRYTDQSVQYIRQENKGLSGARNTGAAHAKGAFLNFLDADDLLKPDFIARCMQVFEADPALMGVYTPWETLVTDPKWAITKKYAAVPPEGMLKQLLNGLAVAQMNGLLMRTEIYRRIGGFRPASAGKDDWLFWFTLYALKAPLYYIPEPLVVYRRHRVSLRGNWCAN
jgi:glycosyltransferase involved in cell wall biosynthesis